MLDKLIAFATDWPLLGHLLITLVAALLINRVVHWVLAALIKRRDPRQKPWRHALLSAADAPLRALIWLVALSVAFNISAIIDSVPYWETFFPPVRDVLVIGTITWWLIRLVNRCKANLIERAAHQEEPLDATAVDAITKICWIVIFISALLVMMQALGFSIAGLLAFGGAAGIAVGFAAQTLVANLFGGLTIFASRIFKLGEYIIIPGTGLMGEVRHIGWRSTLVVGFDRKPFYVPNSLFNTSTLINHSRMERRCVEQYINLRYEDIDKVEAVIRRGNELITHHSGIDQEFYAFRFDSFGERSLRLFLYVFPLATAYVDYMAIKEELLLAIARIIREEGGQPLPITHYSAVDQMEGNLRDATQGAT